MHSEEEQLEDLKAWWKRYRNPVLTALIVGGAVLIGTRTWVNYQEQLSLSASAEYTQLQAEIRAGNTEAVMRRGEYLIENFSATTYAVMAALAMAKVYVEQGQLESAADRLQWAVDSADNPEVAHIARLRLARVLAAADRPQQALALLDAVNRPGAFRASYEELKGDLYVEAGQPERARQAYRNAIEDLEFGSGAEYVQMKLDGLGTEGG